MPSAQFLARRLLINKVAIRDNLLSRGLLGSSTCVLCDNTVETISHLFFNYKVATHIWHICDSWIGQSSVYHNSVEIHFIPFDLIGISNKYNQVWRYMWMTIVWGIWTYRNDVMFRNAIVDVEEIFMLA